MSNNGHNDSARLVKTEDGALDAKIFVDPEIFRLEEERIFARSWLFVAHESEVARPGDFVTRFMGRDPVIVWRGQDGKPRVFLNVCRHRGRKVCGEDTGRAAQFRCPYHGWTYSNLGELIGVPFYEGYEGKLKKEEFGLCEAEVESYRGLIFARWERGGVGLAENLGEMKWVMDLLFGRTNAVEVVGEPMRWEVDANWKLGAANFAGDGTHIFCTHGFRTALGLETIGGARASFALPTEHGHAAAITSWPYSASYDPYFGLPDELWPELERNLDQKQFELMKSLQVVVGNLFPNMSFLNSASHTAEEWGGSGGKAVSFLTIRQWQPKGADKMEVWSWFLADREAPDWWKETSRECYLRSFGMAGMFEQDDMENWGEVTQALKSPMARQLSLQYKMGMGATPSSEWPGPGAAYLQRPTFIEVNERNFYRYWQDVLGLGGAKA